MSVTAVEPRPRLGLPRRDHATPSGDRVSVVGLTIFSAAFLGAFGPWFLTSRAVSDVGIIVGSASRILDGQVPYRDFFLFIGPVGPLLTAAWFALLGQGALSMIAFTVVVGVAIVLGTYWIARHLVPPRWAVGAAGVSLTLGPLFWFTLSHHWFATLFMVLATGAALRANDRPTSLLWPLLAGACCSLAGLSHQGRGGLELFGLLAALWLFGGDGSRLRRVGAAVVGSALAAAVVLGPLAVLVGPATLVYSLISFVLSEYPKANQVSYLAFDLVPSGLSVSGLQGTLQSVLAFGALAVGPLGLVALALRARHWRAYGQQRRASRAVTLLALGGAAWLGALYHPSAVHLGYVAPWFMTAWAAVFWDLVESPWLAIRRFVRPSLVGAAFAWLTFLPLPHWYALASGGIVWVATPTGPTPLGIQWDADRLSGSFPEVASFVLANTSEGEAVAFFPARTVNNVLLRRPNPIRFDLVAAGENTDAQLAEVVADLTVARRARYVIVETEVAERIVAQGVTDEDLHQGRQSMQALRARLPLVWANGVVEIRQAPP